jgi:dihydrofolate synthase/folylpolyglutamate synthase
MREQISQLLSYFLSRRESSRREPSEMDGKPAGCTSGDAPINYRQALAWLYGLQRFGIKLGLENIQRLVAELHVGPASARAPRAVSGASPESSVAPLIIHVAGTNGKGSVCAMIDSILRAQKYRTGLFTSPHLVTFRERIRVNGEMISEDEVANGLTAIRDLIADWQPHPTFFEVTTALALKHFAERKSTSSLWKPVWATT